MYSKQWYIWSHLINVVPIVLNAIREAIMISSHKMQCWEYSSVKYQILHERSKGLYNLNVKLDFYHMYEERTTPLQS